MGRRARPEQQLALEMIREGFTAPIISEATKYTRQRVHSLANEFNLQLKLAKSKPCPAKKSKTKSYLVGN